jgi:hypothetical protein
MKLVIATLSFFVGIAAAETTSPIVSKPTVVTDKKMSRKILQTKAAKRLQKQLAQVQMHSPFNITDEDDDGYDEIDMCVGYRRPEIVHTNKTTDNDELSPYVTVRLALARAKAMAKYREVRG